MLFASGFASVALGVARSSLDLAISLAIAKKPQRDVALLRDRPVIHRSLGQAEAIWGAAHALLIEAAKEAWDSAHTNHSLTTEHRIRLRLAATHAIRTAAEVTDMAYNIAGSDAIFTGNPIQRKFQDSHAITQQIQGRMTHYETAGQFLLGLVPEGDF